MPERGPGGQFMPPPKPAEIGKFEPSDPGQARSGQAGAKVTVACKLPQGLILRLWRMVERDEPVMGGGMRTIKVAEAVGDSVVIHGNAIPFGTAPQYEIAGGYGLTHNVDRDFIEAWLEQNRSLPAVKNGLIFAYENPNDTRDRARGEMAGVRSGLEPLDRENLAADPRVRGVRTRGILPEKAT